MENKRLIIAIVLSLGVLLLWNFFFPPPQPQQPHQQAQQQVREEPQPEDLAPIDQPAQKTEDVPEFKAVEGEEIEVETPEFLAVFNSQGGVLERLELKKYNQTIAKDSPPVDLVTVQSQKKAPMGLIWGQKPTWRAGQWASPDSGLDLQNQATGTLDFQGRLDNLTLLRKISFTAGSYLVQEELVIVNNGQETVTENLSFTLASSGLTSQENRYNTTKIAYLSRDGLKQEQDLDDLELGIASETPVQWAGIESNYFLLAMAPEQKEMGFRAKYEDEIYRAVVDDRITLGPGEQVEILCNYYLGPKDTRYLEGAPSNLEEAIHYGFSDIIAKPLIWVLNYFYSFVGNYGVAIILLTILIKILFWPLSHKSYKSMEQMKKLQPMMAKIREKHKDDRQKMNQEMMQLYKTYKVNPAGGCLPMLLQIPVFFALYQALLGAIELRHAVFIPHLPFTDLVWLADLSAKDPFYITPIIMGGTMFLQQKMTPSPGDPTQAKIMLFMPLIFTFLFLSFPSGLVLYWMVNNVLSIGQQWMLTRKA